VEKTLVTIDEDSKISLQGENRREFPEKFPNLVGKEAGKRGGCKLKKKKEGKKNAFWRNRVLEKGSRSRAFVEKVPL